MNVGLITTGVLVVLGVVLRWRSDRAIRGASGLLMVVAGAAYAVAGLAPADRHENVHVVLAALPIFVFGNLGIVLAGMRRSAWQPRLRLAAVMLGLVGLAALVLFLSGNYLGLGMGGMERLTVWPLMVVLIAAGAPHLRQRI